MRIHLLERHVSNPDYGNRLISEDMVKYKTIKDSQGKEIAKIVIPNRKFTPKTKQRKGVSKEKS